MVEQSHDVGDVAVPVVSENLCDTKSRFYTQQYGSSSVLGFARCEEDRGEECTSENGSV